MIPYISACVRPAGSLPPAECNKSEDALSKDRLTIHTLEAERAFLRKLPEMVQLSRDKADLVEWVKKTEWITPKSFIVEETPEGFRWGWLLIALNKEAKLIQSIRVDPDGFENAFSDMRNCFGEVHNLKTVLDPEILKGK
jgi:hypothetical protein